MPFRQSLRSAFLKFPCGHGGSQFGSKKEEPGTIPSSRIYPPQTGPSDIVSAPPPTVPRTRKTPGIHKDPSNFLGVEDAPHLVNREQLGDETDRRTSSGSRGVKRLSAIGPDYDPPSDVSEQEHHEHIGDPTLERANFDRRSPLREEYRRHSSTGSNTSDYSNHSITHSLRPATPVASSAARPRVDATPQNNAKPRDLAKPRIEPQTSAVAPVTGIERDISDLNLGERRAQERLANEKLDRDFRISPEEQFEEVDYRRRSTQSDTGMYRTMSREDDIEDGHRHKHAGLCADELAQGITSKRQENIPTTTTVRTKPLEPIIHTRVQPREREVVTNVITRETHTTHIHPTILPIVDQTHLPQKHYLECEPGSNKLVEISAEQAERSGWDEVWHGDWVVRGDNATNYEDGVEEDRSNRKDWQGSNALDTHQPKTVLEPPYEGPYETDGASYEMYGSGEVMRDSTLSMPVGYGMGAYSDARRKEKVETLHMPGSYGVGSVLIGPAH